LRLYVAFELMPFALEHVGVHKTLLPRRGPCKANAQACLRQWRAKTPKADTARPIADVATEVLRDIGRRTAVMLEIAPAHEHDARRTCTEQQLVRRLAAVGTEP
jgi:hypothetical protein